jgi:hypothetical protein
MTIACSQSVTTAEHSVAPLRPRLLTLDAAAAYLSLDPGYLRGLIKQGQLARIQVRLGPDRRGRRADGVLRRILVDVADLDALVARWKAGQ